jgi:hypothetical protein
MTTLLEAAFANQFKCNRKFDSSRNIIEVSAEHPWKHQFSTISTDDGAAVNSGSQHEKNVDLPMRRSFSFEWNKIEEREKHQENNDRPQGPRMLEG